jgi:hypothetical protein
MVQGQIAELPPHCLNASGEMTPVFERHPFCEDEVGMGVREGAKWMLMDLSKLVLVWCCDGLSASKLQECKHNYD